MSQPAPATNVFDAAKAIVEVLKDLDKPAQLQAIRFASESLGLGAPPVGEPPTPSLPASPGTPAPSAASQLHSTDIKQFTAAKGPKSDQQFAAVVAYFYRFEAPEAQRKDTIDAATLTDAARLVGRRRPKTPGITLSNAKNAGYLDSAERGQFKISAVGENLVAVTLPGNGSETSATRRARRRPAKKTGRAKKTSKRGE